MTESWDVYRPSALAGRRALVTGAGQGVGAAIARALARAGAAVVVNDVSAERAGAVADEIGGTAAVGDVTDLGSVRSVIAAHGPFDVVVNNAGNAGASATLSMVPFVDADPSGWAAPLAVNLTGVLNVTHAALPAMIERRWGRLITIVSDAARVGDAGIAAYAAAKAGAAGFTRSIARENGRFGITANSVALGSIDTGGRDPDVVARQVRSYPLRRLGTPDDIAGIVVFLASDASSWLTGQTIPVNGGYSSAL